jgi:hypothetical protein
MPSSSSGGGGCYCGVGSALSLRGSSATAFCELNEAASPFFAYFDLLLKLHRYRLGLVLLVLPVSRHAFVLLKNCAIGFVP